jgi:hypothetical protein
MSSNPNLKLELNTNVASIRDDSRFAVHQYLMSDNNRDQRSRFLKFVEASLEELIVSHGYSRERATKALLHAFSRSIAPSTLVVSDEQVSCLFYLV